MNAKEIKQKKIEELAELLNKADELPPESRAPDGSRTRATRVAARKSTSARIAGIGSRSRSDSRISSCI